MLDIGWQELFIVAVLVIIVIGPKDLPGAMRTVAAWVRKARSLATPLSLLPACAVSLSVWSHWIFTPVGEMNYWRRCSRSAW